MPEIGTFGTRQISRFRARGLPSQFRSALDTILTQAGPLPATFAGLDARLWRRLRAIVWKQWKRGSARFVELRRRGVGPGPDGTNRRQPTCAFAAREQPRAQHRSAKQLLRFTRLDFRRGTATRIVRGVVWEG